MLEELQRRNYSPKRSDLTCMPSKISPATSARVRTSSARNIYGSINCIWSTIANSPSETIVGRISALRFFFVKVLRRPYREIDLVYPKRPSGCR